MQDNGFRRDQGDGSHVVYRHPALIQRVTISPHDAFVKSYQVKQSLAALDAVRAMEEQLMTIRRIEITPEVERLARRPYCIVVERDEDGDWVARVPELPGLITGGTTLDEMYAMVEDAKRMWIASALADGAPVPEPVAVPV